MEYQKNIATNVYHGFGALINLIIAYVMLIKKRTWLVESSVVYSVLAFLISLLFLYHLISMKKIK